MINIDFSGYAYSFTQEPENIHIMRKWEGDDPGINPYGPCGTNQPEVINASYAGHISSPGYPNEYPNNADCSWLLQTNADDLIQLTIMEFDLESE